ncbi:hypothetical protein D3C71_1145060 [compost metagenome]
MNIRRYRKALERTYTDRVTAQRNGKYTDPVTHETRLGLYQVYADKPCRISQKSLGSNGQTETVNNIAYEIKLFAAPELDIKQGDKLTVTRGRVTRIFTAGEPFPYPTHQEISLGREAKA